MQRLRDPPGAPLGKPMSGGLPAHARIDGIKFTDPAQEPQLPPVSHRLSDLVELAPRVGPAGGEHDISIAGQPLESRVAINVQDAFEVRAMRHRLLRFLVRREQIDRCRWRWTAP